MCFILCVCLFVSAVALCVWACALCVSQCTIGVTVHHRYPLQSLTFTVSQHFIDLLHFLSSGQQLQLYFILLWLQMGFAVFLFEKQSKWCQRQPARRTLQGPAASTAPSSKYARFILHIETFLRCVSHLDAFFFILLMSPFGFIFQINAAMWKAYQRHISLSSQDVIVHDFGAPTHMQKYSMYCSCNAI